MNAKLQLVCATDILFFPFFTNSRQMRIKSQKVNQLTLLTATLGKRLRNKVVTQSLQKERLSYFAPYDPRKTNFMVDDEAQVADSAPT